MNNNSIVNKYLKANQANSINTGKSVFKSNFNSNPSTGNQYLNSVKASGGTLGGTKYFNGNTGIYRTDGLGNYTPTIPANKNVYNTPLNQYDTTSPQEDTTTSQQPQYSTGYEGLVNSFMNSGNRTSLPNYGVFNPYMSVGNTNLSYYKNLASSIENNLNSLFTAKYGAGNYNMNNGWYQGDALADWDRNAENQGFAQYQKLITDLYNVNNMIAQYQSIEQDRQQQTARLGVQQDLIEKYLQEDRRIRGIENSGQAETSTNAILNAYINAGNQLRQNAQNNLHEQEMNFQNAQYESMNNFNNQLQALQESEEETRTSDLKDLISYASTADDFKLLEENFGDEISNNKVLQYLFENAKINAENYATEEANAEALGKYLTNYGVTAEQGISATDLNPSMFNWSGSGEGKKQDNLINITAEMAQAGVIQNGYILDLNRGKNSKGTSLYLYYNGAFYPVDADKYSVTKGWQGRDIEDRYEEWKASNK